MKDEGRKKMALEFGVSTKRLRKEAGISRSKLGKMISIDDRLLARYESGDTCPSLHKAVKISQFFCVDIRSMIEPVSFPSADSVKSTD